MRSSRLCAANPLACWQDRLSNQHREQGGASCQSLGNLTKGANLRVDGGMMPITNLVVERYGPLPASFRLIFGIVL